MAIFVLSPHKLFWVVTKLFWVLATFFFCHVLVLFYEGKKTRRYHTRESCPFYNNGASYRYATNTLDTESSSWHQASIMCFTDFTVKFTKLSTLRILECLLLFSQSDTWCNPKKKPSTTKVFCVTVCGLAIVHLIDFLVQLIDIPEIL